MTKEEKDREEWMKDLDLPYNMKKSELIKEKLFFDEYPDETEEKEGEVITRD